VSEGGSDAWSRLSKLLSALSNPTRLKILALCAERERSSKELRELLGISKPLLIAHLKVLMRAGLIEFRAEIDEVKYIVRKYYRTKDFRICVGRDELLKLLREEGVKS